jgi:hypothetical protein
MYTILNENFLIKICPLANFTIVISWDFLPKGESPESFLWTHFLEAFVEDMLPTAYVDARTTKFYIHELFLAVPIFAS